MKKSRIPLDVSSRHPGLIDDARVRWSFLSGREDAKPVKKKRRAAKSQSILDAVEALWPDGIPSSLMAKVRNEKITKWIAQKGLAPVDDRTIRDALGKQSS
jgi:hypothetical protein